MKTPVCNIIIIIKIGTKMIQKYPYSIWFAGFQNYVQRAIDAEKNK